MSPPVWIEEPAALAEAAAFFAAEIAGDPAYISHGEIQEGLSPDGRTWAPDLAARLTQGFAALEAGQRIAVVRDGAGAIIAAAVVAFETTGPAAFAVLEDLAVAAAARSGGYGAALIAFIEAEARARGCAWVFLESGRHNHRAHAFFARQGFETVSQVFAKRLG